MKKVLLLSAALLLFSQSAAASDDNIRVSNLWNEDNPDDYWSIAGDVERQTLFNNLVWDLGVAVSQKLVQPGETLGASGFELSFDTIIAPVGVVPRCNESVYGGLCQYQADQTDAWRVMDADHRLTFGNALVMPTFRLRKGLPFSTEVGADFTYLAFSHQTAFSPYFRVSPHEGMWDGQLRIIPDVSFLVGGTRFLGNEELSLSTRQLGLTLGWTVPVAGIRDSHVGTFSPLLSVSKVYISGTPDGDLPDQLSTLEGVTGRASKAVAASDGVRAVTFDTRYQPWKLGLGFRVTSGLFQLHSSLELPIDPILGHFVKPGVNFGLGFLY